MYLAMVHGDELVFELDILRGNQPFPLTDSHVFFTVKKSRHVPGEPILELSTVVGGVEILDENNGTVQVTIGPEDSKKFPNETRRYDFDIRVRENDGSVFTVLQDTLYIQASVGVL